MPVRVSTPPVATATRRCSDFRQPFVAPAARLAISSPQPRLKASAHSDANGRVDLRGLPAVKVTLLALRQREGDYRYGRPNYALLKQDEEEEPIAFEIDLTHPVPELKELVLPW